MLNTITDQGLFGVVCAVLGVVAGVYLSRTIRRRRAETQQRKRAMTPKVYSSRQEMRKAEREQRKKEER